MIARMLSTVLAVLLLAGCVSVRSVDVTGSDAAFSEFNSSVRGKVARVTLQDGTKMDVVGARVETGSLTWVNRPTNTIDRVPVDDVRQVSVVKAGSGAVRGLFIGLVAGAALGVARAAMEGDDPTSDPLAVTQKEKYRIYPAAHAVYASLATTPLGAIIGTRRVYRFEGGRISASR